MPHTPGPWYYEQPAGGFSAIRRESNAKLIFHVANPSPIHGDPDTGDEEKLANLRIAANAPNLLATLKDILPLAEKYLHSAPTHPDNSRLCDARDAIAKAEGR